MVRGLPGDMPGHANPDANYGNDDDPEEIEI